MLYVDCGTSLVVLVRIIYRSYTYNPVRAILKESRRLQFGIFQDLYSLRGHILLKISRAHIALKGHFWGWSIYKSETYPWPSYAPFHVLHVRSLVPVAFPAKIFPLQISFKSYGSHVLALSRFRNREPEIYPFNERLRSAIPIWAVPWHAMSKVFYYFLKLQSTCTCVYFTLKTELDSVISPQASRKYPRYTFSYGINYILLGLGSWVQELVVVVSVCIWAVHSDYGKLQYSGVRAGHGESEF